MSLTRLTGAVVCTALAVIAAGFAPERALPGWLAAFAFCAGVPVGALWLLMIMRMVPGAWSEALAPGAAAAALLLPLVALAAVPLALGLDVLYPWTRIDLGTPFRAVWFDEGFAVLRSLVFLGAGFLAAVVLAGAGRRVRPIATAALVVFVPVHTLIAFDWLMSLDPAFHSSIFGLYVLSMQATSALAVLIAARLLAAPAKEPGPLGALLLTALLLWSYFAFMQYLIIWSDNLPAGVAWYLRRTAGGWGVVFPVIAVLHGLPLLLLLFPPLRASRVALLGMCAATLAGKALEVGVAGAARIPVRVAAGRDDASRHRRPGRDRPRRGAACVAADPSRSGAAMSTGHETRDLPPRAILLALAGIFVLIAATGGGVALLLRTLDRRAVPQVGAVPFPAEAEATGVPRLQVDQAAERMSIEAGATQKLESYGWTDRSAGLARIPIDRAMAILAERGWPDPAQAKAPAQ